MNKFDISNTQLGLAALLIASITAIISASILGSMSILLYFFTLIALMLITSLLIWAVLGGSYPDELTRVVINKTIWFFVVLLAIALSLFEFKSKAEASVWSNVQGFLEFYIIPLMVGATLSFATIALFVTMVVRVVEGYNFSKRAKNHNKKQTKSA